MTSAYNVIHCITSVFLERVVVLFSMYAIHLLLQALKSEAETLKQAGNELFKNGEYVQAISQYTQGLQTCPLAYSKERSILYANRAAAKAKCQVIVKDAFID